jgi:hypothetical protein
VDKRLTLHKSSLETQAASRTNSATNMTLVAVAVATGFILVAVAISVISVVIALARKRGLLQERGMFQHPASRKEMPEWMCGMVIVE